MLSLKLRPSTVENFLTHLVTLAVVQDKLAKALRDTDIDTDLVHLFLIYFLF